VLVLGVIAPVEVLIVKPAGVALYVPASEPVRVTACSAVSLLQNVDALYEIVASGASVIVTCAGAVTCAQPFAAAMV
jgi:glutamine amidotransferase PdxT